MMMMTGDDQSILSNDDKDRLLFFLFFLMPFFLLQLFVREISTSNFAGVVSDWLARSYALVCPSRLLPCGADVWSYGPSPSYGAVRKVDGKTTRDAISAMKKLA